MDSAGNLYGTTFGGGILYQGACGSHGCGTVFRLSPGGNGMWSETILYSFDGSVKEPAGGVLFDSAGNLYGTAQYDVGAVYELTPGPNDTWTETILQNFPWNSSSGSGQNGGLVFDSSGNLYGTTNYGGNLQYCDQGNSEGCGVVFQLKP